jgi:hypothetical protein
VKTTREPFIENVIVTRPDASAASVEIDAESDNPKPSAIASIIDIIVAIVSANFAPSVTVIWKFATVAVV